MIRLRALNLASLAVALCGTVCCGLLLAIHADGKASGWVSSLCGDGHGGCEQVVHSRWGMFPPTGEDSLDGAVGPGEPRGIPVAALGLFYFSLLLIWFGALGAPQGEGRSRLGAISVVLCTLGALGSTFYLCLMVFVTKSWCPLCLTSHVCSFLSLGLAVSSLVVRAETTGHDSVFTPNSALVPPAAHPGLRLSIVSLLLFGAVCVAEWSVYRAATLAAVAEYAAELQNDGAYLEAAHFGQTRYALNPEARSRMRNAPEATLNVRDDDPMILPQRSGYVHTLVIFSDIECPACARFDRFLEEKVRPLYEGHLRLVYKHNPMTHLHRYALEGAQALEAARLQGKFWEMKEILRENRRHLAGFDYAAAAARLHLDVDRFLDDLNSRAVRDRILEDRRTAAALESRTTPDVFLSGRRVDPAIRDLIAFWRARAGALKSRRLQEKQGWGADGPERRNGRNLP